MIRTVALSLALVLGLAFAPAPAGAAGQDDSTVTASAPALVKFAWMWTEKTPPASRPYIPVAACTMECCCQLFVDGSMKSQCKSRDDCMTGGGICRSNSDPKCK